MQPCMYSRSTTVAAYRRLKKYVLLGSIAEGGRVLLLTTLHNLLTNRDDDDDGDDGDIESSNPESESIDESDIDSES